MNQDIRDAVTAANPFVYICANNKDSAREIWSDDQPESFTECSYCVFWGFYGALEDHDKDWFDAEWGWEFV